MTYILSSKTVDEVLDIVVDTTELLGPHESALSATCTATLSTGGDGSAILSGSPTILSPLVKQRITGGTAGSTYILKFTITTSPGTQKFVERAQISVTA